MRYICLLVNENRTHDIRFSDGPTGAHGINQFHGRRALLPGRRAAHRFIFKSR